jgi:hypothetical protein
MGTLMRNGGCKFGKFAHCNRLPIEIGVVECNQPWIFHGTEFVLMAENSIILLELIWNTKFPLEKIEGEPRHFEDEVTHQL